MVRQALWMKGQMMPRMILTVVFAVLVAGCGGHQFLQSAPVAVAEAANELDTGVDEYHAAAVEEMTRAAATQRAALKADLAEYIVEVIQAGVDPAEVTAADVADRIAVNFETFEQQQSSLAAERAVENQRYVTMKGLCDWVRKVAGQIVEIETRRYATIEELRDMAVEYARKEVEEGVP